MADDVTPVSPGSGVGAGSGAFVVEEGAVDDEWRGTRSVASGGTWLDVNDLGIRKGMCRWWTLRWDEKALASSR